MPYKSTRYRDMDAEMVEKLKRAFEKQINKALEEFNPDIIICHHLYLLTAFVREVVKEKDIKIAAVCHGTCLRQLKTIPLERDYIKENIRNLDMLFALHEEQKRDIMSVFNVGEDKVKVDMLFALHEEQKRDIMSVFNVGEDKVKVIGSGFNDNIFKNKNYNVERGYIELVFAGKICKSKGLIPFIDCLDRLDYKDDFIKIRLAGTGSDKESYDIELVFAGKICKSKGLIPFIDCLDRLDYKDDFIKIRLAGTGSDKESYDEIVEKAKESRFDIKFLGKLNQDDLSEEFNKADIFVLPSFYEGLPVVVLEKIKSG